MQLPLFPARPATEVLAELERLRRIRPTGPRAPKPPSQLEAQALALTEEQRQKALARLRRSNPRTKAQRLAWVRQLVALAKAAPNQQLPSPDN